MTKKTAGIALALLSCVVVSGSGVDRLSASRAATTIDAQQTIIRLENRWLANEASPAFLESVLADDFVHVVPEGLISKQEHIDFVRTHPHPFASDRRFQKLQVRVYGSVAIANGIVVSVREGGSAAPRTLFTDVFAFRNGKWQAVNAQETPASDDAP